MAIKRPEAPSNLRCEYRTNPLGLDIKRPRLSWQVNDSRRGAIQSAYHVLAASSKELLAVGKCDVWDSGKVISDDSIHIEYAGIPLVSRRRYFWKVRTWNSADKPSLWSRINWWETGLLHHSEWKADWIGLKRKKSDKKTPSPFLRRELTIGKKIKSARIYITARGLYTAYINGNRVGKDYFTPGWTDYNKRLQYQTYDITGFIRKGENAIGAILGDGWYCGHVGLAGRNIYGSYPELLAQIHIRYSDDTEDMITTDRSWKAACGPIVSSDILMGEDYDARKEFDGWNKPGFNDSRWSKLSIRKPANEILASQYAPTVQKVKRLKPVCVVNPKKGVYVFDLGQNMSGWACLSVRGRRGQKVRLRHAEVLNPDGTIYTENLRSAKAQDTYILKGKGTEEFEPHFTYHGFRFVEVTGYPGKPSLDSITGVAIQTAIPQTGQFKCSSRMVNRLFRNIFWGQRSNFIEVPTDCPQRDERLGWTGDIQTFAPTACFNMDSASFMTKWLRDVREAQSDAGAYPDVAPRVAAGEGTAAWGDAGIICPWNIWLYYGDRKILDENYESMKKWIHYLGKNSSKYIRPDKGYGDWLSVKAETPKDLIATAYYAKSVQLFAEIAGILDRKSEKKKYLSQFKEIKDAFIREYVTSAGRITGETQTAYVLALKLDLLPRKLRDKAAKRIIQDIEKRKGHLSTGFLGTSLIMDVLTEIGRDDIAYQLLLNETFPSWGYMVKHGATTMWESWDSFTKEKGFANPSMNSFNHYSLGSVSEWLYKSAAGISPDPGKPGFKHMIIRPRLDTRLKYASATYDSIHGKISSHWKVVKDMLYLDVIIPSNTTASIYLPVDSAEFVRESGRKLERTEGIDSIETVNGEIICRAGAGSYSFTIRMGR